jgi:hypothetical protein
MENSNITIFQKHVSIETNVCYIIYLLHVNY